MPVRNPDMTDKQWSAFERKMKTKYRNTFSKNQDVLADILQELRFFDAIRTEEDRILHNFAKRLLYLCGGWTTQISFTSKD